MAKCPSCGSSRIRNDYRPAPLALRIFFIRAFLCNHCNYQFKAFSITDAPVRQRQQSAVNSPYPNSLPGRDVNLTGFMGSEGSQSETQAEIHHDLRPENTDHQPQEAEDRIQPIIPDNQRQSAGAIACAHCNSTNVQRRRRTKLERMLFSATDHKAFICCSCGETFYSTVESS